MKDAEIPNEKIHHFDEKLTSDQRVHIFNSPDEIIRIIRGGEDSPPGIAHMLMPMRIEGERIGSVFLSAPSGCTYSQADALLLDLLHDPLAIAMSNVLRHQEVLRYKEKIEEENSYLNREVRRLSSEGNIIGLDSGMKEVKKIIQQVAPMNTSVLLTGETGTGKEVVAGAIQRLSNRSDGPFIKVNCGAIPENLVDSELFGHEKGAFTGAAARKIGRFERAHGGTIFLDEVGELPLDIQVKLLRCIQQKEIERVGSMETIALDIRIIAATHRDLETMVAGGRYREDLYYRLNVFPVKIPHLRERKEDIPALDELTFQHIQRVLNLTKGKIKGPGGAAELLDVNPYTLRSRMDKLGIPYGRSAQKS
ncbi:MAG: AAA domain-containing protein [Desulfobacteraceae bacterium]|nr:AAA domain-containing protein [Desulfobacteraceae bacterium]